MIFTNQINWKIILYVSSDHDGSVHRIGQIPDTYHWQGYALDTTLLLQQALMEIDLQVDYTGKGSPRQVAEFGIRHEILPDDADCGCAIPNLKRPVKIRRRTRTPTMNRNDHQNTKYYTKRADSPS